MSLHCKYRINSKQEIQCLQLTDLLKTQEDKEKTENPSKYVFPLPIILHPNNLGENKIPVLPYLLNIKPYSLL